jgi:hypothetical protein
MKKLKLASINIGENNDENVYIEFIQHFDNLDIEIFSKNTFRLSNSNNYFESQLTILEEDVFSTTYLGEFPNNEKFRIISFSEITKELLKKKGENETLSFGSVNTNGYAIHFELIESGSTKNEHFFSVISIKKQNFKGLELALLSHAFFKNLFPKPEKGEILYKEYNDDTLSLYFDEKYYEELRLAVNFKFINGDFSTSNSEKDWINLKNKIDNATSEKLPNETLEIWNT